MVGRATVLTDVRCRYCGKTAGDGVVLHLDHVEPVAAGGEATEDDLITACDECNLGKSDRDLFA
jgi:5-methylcytosine-specific restriction endonuclease McrA